MGLGNMHQAAVFVCVCRACRACVCVLVTEARVQPLNHFVTQTHLLLCNRLQEMTR